MSKKKIKVITKPGPPIVPPKTGPAPGPPIVPPKTGPAPDQKPLPNPLPNPTTNPTPIPPVPPADLKQQQPTPEAQPEAAKPSWFRRTLEAIPTAVTDNLAMAGNQWIATRALPTAVNAVSSWLTGSGSAAKELEKAQERSNMGFGVGPMSYQNDGNFNAAYYNNDKQGSYNNTMLKFLNKKSTINKISLYGSFMDSFIKHAGFYDYVEDNPGGWLDWYKRNLSGPATSWWKYLTTGAKDIKGRADNLASGYTTRPGIVPFIVNGAKGTKDYFFGKSEDDDNDDSDRSYRRRRVTRESGSGEVAEPSRRRKVTRREEEGLF